MTADPLDLDIIYNPDEGVFQDARTGRAVPKTDIQLEINREIARVARKLQSITQAMADGRITLEEWQKQFIAILKDSHLQMAAFGAGGVEQLDTEHFQYIGFQLKQEYDALEGFAAALVAGSLTLAQALRRAGMYAESIRLSFSQADWVTHVRDGFEGARSLSVAQHCKQCPDYDTGGEFLSADQLVPIGHDCDCKRKCKCFIVWRKRRLSALSGRLLAAA